MAFCYQRCTDRRGSEYIEITGYAGGIRHLVVPEQMEGLPVRVIGKNAFSGREDLEEVLLPASIDTLGRYAFYNCKNFKNLSLYDGVEDYYDGVIKQCQSLSRITLTQRQGSFSVMKELLADNDRTLHFVVEPMGLHLTFPAYVYDFVEDVEARVLHHKIEGSGYPYRECVTRKGVDLLTYDRLFDQAVSDDYKAAIEVALNRLMYPVGLEPDARERYEQYLEQNGACVVEKLIEEQALEEICCLCDNCLIQREVLEEALYLAADRKQAAISAVLMEYQREHFTGKVPVQTLSLEDW